MARRSWQNFYVDDKPTPFLAKNLAEFGDAPKFLDNFVEDINSKFASGESLLHYAVKKESKPLVDALLSRTDRPTQRRR